MKKKFSLVLLSLLILIGSLLNFPLGRAGAVSVTENCQDIPTTITANVPTSVAAGSTFSITGITAQPSTSYGVTVTSSTLNIQASYANPGTYNNQDESTSPGTTTGAQTYTAYYPDWTLTSTGDPGTPIVLRLSSLLTTLEPAATTSCGLGSVFATINVTPASSSSASGSATASTTNKTNAGSSGASTNYSYHRLSVKFLTSKGQTAHNVLMKIDGGKYKTANNGQLTFVNLAGGSHELVINYGGNVYSYNVAVSYTTTTTAVTITQPSHTFFTRSNKIVLVSMADIIVVVAGFAFLLTKFLKRRKISQAAKKAAPKPPPDNTYIPPSLNT